MFVRVTLNVSPSGPQIVVPSAAVQTDGASNRVFVIRGGRSYQVAVDVGVTDGERTAILRGLGENDTVATLGVNNLRDSSLVTVAHR